MDSDGLLFNQSELENAIETGELIAWKKQRYLEFRKTMRETRYPCHFAVQAERTDSARYLFAGDARNRDALLKVREGLRQYLERYQSIAKRTTLVIFFEPTTEDQSEQEYRDQFWRVLELLNRQDPEPWPSDVPDDPNDPEWEFCFSGEPMFIVGRAPFYTDRKSRYTPYGLEITIQPRRTLDDISGDTMEGQRARSVIRDRLTDYDDVEPHPDIGDYGDPSTREWKQYLLPTSNEEGLSEFPFEIDTE
ncbi:YqcI/YcgG family protein [Haloprofundus salinisoli]|uniref:YqcI/YcgG family protein n=1 Tax=Haloprofundus salinisoli TaxID=2876193 RepID=UPI001CCA210E|nr:YqcI/YcgG family protein [Haloprofundus salinisoli]